MRASRAWLCMIAMLTAPFSALAGASEPPPGASSCSGCHATRRVDTAVPPLIGRPAADIIAQMQAFKSGQKPATVMDRIAKGFTDAEIQDIANWYAQQK
jgi:cytochrome subunit of sulfide dehydrogenase